MNVKDFIIKGNVNEEELHNVIATFAIENIEKNRDIDPDLVKWLRSVLPDALSGHPILSALKEFRTDYARHVQRQDILADDDRLRSKPRWRGTDIEGVKPSEFVCRHYSAEIEAGLRYSDLRQCDERLYLSLRNQARNAPEVIEELGFDKSHAVMAARRHILAQVLDQPVTEPEFSSYFNGLHQARSKPDRGVS